MSTEFSREGDPPVYEIRSCRSCGLRYPLQRNSAFGERCPVCLGETEAVIRGVIRKEGSAQEKPAKRKGEFRAILLDNIRSAWNVGSIFRSADGFGYEHVYLCGITPTPESDAVTKTSLGAEETIPWSYHKDAVRLAAGLKKEGWRILGLEEGNETNDLSRAKAGEHERSVLILGSEVTGVDPDLLALCDEVYSIPMRGHKRSLNVAIAFSVAAFALQGDSD